MILNLVKLEIVTCSVQKLGDHTVVSLRNKTGGHITSGSETDNKLLHWFELVLSSTFTDSLKKGVRGLSKLFEGSSWLAHRGCCWFGDSGLWLMIRLCGECQGGERVSPLPGCLPCVTKRIKFETFGLTGPVTVCFGLNKFLLIKQCNHYALDSAVSFQDRLT